MNNNSFNLIAALVLSFCVMAGWQYFYPAAPTGKIISKKVSDKKKILSTNLPISNQLNDSSVNSASSVESISRVIINSPSLKGSISLKGIRFDDLVLIKYKEELDPNSDFVKLLQKSDSKDAYFVDLGWIGGGPELDLPNADTIWDASSLELSPTNPVSLTWNNKQSIQFIVNISLDENYLLTIKQSIINNSNKEINTGFYGLINRTYNSNEKLLNILHQGPIGYIDGGLEEYSYDKVKDKKNIKFRATNMDWVGITDKYWLVAFMPDKQNNYDTSFQYVRKGKSDKYQVDFIAPSKTIAAGSEYSITNHLFAGAKKVDLLDQYEKNYNIKLFDRAIDFGWFYILTKPVFNALNFFYKYTHNFGVSILIVTIIIKLMMFSLANKSYKSMKKMKKIQPEVERIKALYGDDKMKLNQEIMGLYKTEKINPVSGCLPLLLQIPVFFSIYKVLYVTIEMRHAPFFGWIKDLSAPDPTNIFNLFGLIPFDPPSFLMIGIWPIIMAITMFMQQQMSPPPADPVQAQVMKFMPLFFLVMFSSFPAGLLIYWSWNNILSIIQQYSINKLSN